MHVTKYLRKNHGVFEGKQTTTKRIYIKVVRHYVQKHLLKFHFTK